MGGGHRGGAGAGPPLVLATQILCYLYNKDDVINDQPPPVAAIRNIEIVSRTPLLSCLGPGEQSGM